MMQLRQVGTLAMKEFRDRLRNRWVLAVALVFAVFSLVITYAGGAQQGAVGVRGKVDRRLGSLAIATLFAGAITTLGEIARAGDFRHRLINDDLQNAYREFRRVILDAARGTEDPSQA